MGEANGNLFEPDFNRAVKVQATDQRKCFVGDRAFSHTTSPQHRAETAAPDESGSIGSIPQLGIQPIREPRWLGARRMSRLDACGVVRRSCFV